MDDKIKSMNHHILEVDSEEDSEIVSKIALQDSEAESSKLLHSLMRDLGNRKSDLKTLNITKGIYKRKLK